MIVAALARNPALRPTATEFALQIACGMPNGAALLAALAPRIAADARTVGAGEVRLPSDVPAALSPPAPRTQGH